MGDRIIAILSDVLSTKVAMRTRPSLKMQDLSYEGHTQNGALNCGMLTEGTGLPGSSSSAKRSSGAPVGSRRSSTVPSVCAVPQRPISSHSMRALRHQHSHLMHRRSTQGMPRTLLQVAYLNDFCS